ncbi:hypothetical protein D1820_01905 [Phaeobacter sp. LSS9]|uniref:hypothetical protein n=1 Tax=unclassified Phaeobacter TaxID=2621772 RepID=UPI000E540358|nr:hypothetical protein [Phaeobacter sp. LSS9]AXT33823.1 hypothetical protein D1820_01905 [Phaeobacter sp. LSS9]
MTIPNFKVTYQNPFNELSELRLKLNASDDNQFEVTCRIRFSVMHHEHNGREYTVGLKRAFLRLNLEGCETTLDPVFGENELAAATDEATLEFTSRAGGDFNAKAGTESKPNAGVGFSAAVEGTGARRSSLRNTRLPMTAKPNDTWEVAAQSVGGTAQANLDGTAIAGQRLCTIQRREGGNRLAVTGEIQASKGAVNVLAKGGNKWGKDFAVWGNKDAVIGQVLRKALERETVRTSSGVFVASRCEVAEE